MEIERWKFEVVGEKLRARDRGGPLTRRVLILTGVTGDKWFCKIAYLDLPDKFPRVFGRGEMLDVELKGAFRRSNNEFSLTASAVVDSDGERFSLTKLTTPCKP